MSERHDPMWLDAHRNGRWVECSCGWISKTYYGAAGPQVEFGAHLLQSLSGCTQTAREGR